MGERIPALVAHLKDGNAEAKLQAATALKTLAFVAENRALIADAGAIPLLVALLKDGKDEARLQVVTALGNLAAAAEKGSAWSLQGPYPPQLRS